MGGILVGGMHFTGLDLATSALERAGWVLTRDPRADASRGTTMDDPRLVKLHMNWLRSVDTSPRALPSWGVDAQVDVRGPTQQALADQDPMGLSAGCDLFDRENSRFERTWIAQDALSVFTARIWADATPVQFVFVYRNPWDCVDAAARSGQPRLADDPDFVRRTWLGINQLVVEFAREYPERCTLVAAEALAVDPGALARHIGTDGTAAADHTAADHTAAEHPAAEHPAAEHPAAELAVRDDSSPIAAMYRQLYPELVELLDELDDVADIPRPTSEIATVEQYVPERVRPAGTMPEGTGTQVVIVCRDDVAFLAEAVASVIASATAASGDVELTIVNDGSTDDEAITLLQRLDEAGLDVMVTPSVGQPAARDAALSASATACVLPLDQRSRLLPPLLEEEDLVTSGACDVVVGPWRDGGSQCELRTPPEPSARTMFPRNPMPDTALIARTLVDAVGGWDATANRADTADSAATTNRADTADSAATTNRADTADTADWGFWLSCLERGARFRRVTEPTAESWAQRGSSAPADRALRENGLQSLARKHEALLSPHLGSYIADLDAEVSRLRDALNLARAEVGMVRSAAASANARLTADLDAARAAIGRLQSELEFRIVRGEHPSSLTRTSQPRAITVDRPLLFLHIPKTGGTSFRRMLQDEFGRDRVYPSDSDLIAAPRHGYPSTSRVIQAQRSLPSHAVLIGHFDAGLIDALRREYRTALFLRDPLQRALSELAWHSRKDGRDVEFYLQRPEFLVARVANLQTKVLAGRVAGESSRPSDEALLDAAWSRLLTIDFVGLTEEYFTSCLRFDRMFGTSISRALKWDNVTRPTGEELAQYAEALEPYLELDTVLYQRTVATIAAEDADAIR